METESNPAGTSRQDELYEEAASAFGPPLERLARGYEADPTRRRDLLQEVHLALWQSLASFDGRCSLRTWVYRVAHNVATSHMIRDRRFNARTLVGLDEVDPPSTEQDGERLVDQHLALEKLVRLIHQLAPVDRQVILSYLEGLDAVSIAEITGISPGNVATKIHRIKNVLARRFHDGGRHGQ
ncbi:MAG TPA: sigma-70 family RNA polymerase sigma factor [Thermoanaerobaculaceae bacterium]|nr:sigma-70 family RNA polymerase sigma factor [Thermoanaerobaculaceae bacterium]HPS76862.1 sigma-70 family RNA polymerase sigma factor [Thermoanaerobaculaceae bacterium]